MTSQELEILRSVMPGTERNYRQTGTYSWNWSCSICGDSNKDRRKARFGVSKVGQELLCNCFNCGWAGTFLTYLKYQHPDLAKRVSRQSFVNNTNLNAYSPDRLVQELDSETLSKIFYINTIIDKRVWLATLARKKIILTKDNIHKLNKIHNEVHHG